VDADIYINKIIDDHPYLVRARDISVSGMFVYRLIEPDLDIPPGEFGFELRLPGSDDTIWAVGKIVREVENLSAEGCAIEFVRLGARDRQLIRAYVSEQLTEGLRH